MAAGVSAGISEGYAESHNDTQSVGLYGKTAERTKDWEDFRKNAKGIFLDSFCSLFFCICSWRMAGERDRHYDTFVSVCEKFHAGYGGADWNNCGAWCSNGMLRLIFSIAYQEEMIETNLLDYMENEKDSAGRIVKIEPPIANEAKKAAAKKMSRKARSKARQQEQKLREELLRAQKERARNGGRESPSAVRSQQQKMEQVEARIREAALTDERYRHLLDEEEEKIVKDVIKEFLS